ncbi:MAG: DUF711 family protein [Patescibacteria group bacterium]
MKIKIRTITLQSFLEEQKEVVFKNFQDNLKFFEKNGYKPRTFRVVSNQIIKSDSEIKKLIKKYIINAHKYNFWGICLPFNMFNKNYIEILNLAREVSKEGKDIFLNFLPVIDKSIHLKAVPEISKFILENAKDPIDNFRIGVSSGKFKTPFFPFSCAVNNNEFIVGLEIVGPLTDLVKNNSRMDLDGLRELMIVFLTEELQQIQTICYDFEKKSGLKFGGLDLSLAPYPYPLEDQSVSALIEEIGCIARSRGESLFEFGSSGTHFINSFLTNILKSIVNNSDIKTTGFNGIMYSVLEDTFLSKGYENDNFNLDFLKLLSTTCGCGLDMVPLPGDTANSSISGIILDVLSTSIILKKPLGVRLLPIPNSRHGDKTKFKHLFFSNTEIKEIRDGVTLEYLPNQQNYFKFKE